MAESHESMQKRTVTFAPDTQDTFTPTRKPHVSAASRMWIKYLGEGELEKLRTYISKCERKGLSVSELFRSDQGRRLVNWATTLTINPTSLRFIYQCVPHEILKPILQQDNYRILNGFLVGQTGLDSIHENTPEVESARLEKLQIFLGIAQEEVSSFIQSHLPAQSEGVRSCFESAIQSQYRPTMIV